MILKYITWLTLTGKSGTLPSLSSHKFRPLYGEVWVCDCGGTKTHKAAGGDEGTKCKCFKDWSLEVKSTEKDEALPLASIIRICSSCEYTDWAPLWFWSCLSMMWSRMRNHQPYIIFERPPAVQYWTLSTISSSLVIFPSSSIYDNLDPLSSGGLETRAPIPAMHQSSHGWYGTYGTATTNASTMNSGEQEVRNGNRGTCSNTPLEVMLHGQNRIMEPVWVSSC